MQRISILFCALLLGFAQAGSAVAQVKPETLVKQRQAAMTLQGKYFGPLGAMAQGKVPFDANIVARNAGFLAALSRMPWDGFAASTKEVKSGALPAVFTDAAKFKAAQERLQSEVDKLVAVSQGAEAAVKAQIVGVGNACGGCHESFREKQ
jgi:cytochrome c556